jgi:site-specific DNA-methyltransferase (adenine-specific)
MSAIDLRLGRWQDVLTDVEVDAVICDPPYGERTHAGQPGQRGQDGAGFRSLGYSSLDPYAVHEIVREWAPRTRGWMCFMTSHDLIPHYEAALSEAGRYVFAPLPVINRYLVRLAGDGPGSGSVWMMVARPRTSKMSKWGALPAWYIRSAGDAESPRQGGKPLGLMRAIVRDYSRPGDLVCDPFAGGGTTLAAAILEGRRAIGAEVDPAAHAVAMERLAGTGSDGTGQRGLFG